MDWTKQAEQIVTLIRSQDVDHGESVALVAQALAMAHSAGALDAAKETGDRMLRTFDAAYKVR